MATSPMMADPGADPSADPSASTEDTDMSQGFVIEIKCMPNRMFSVCIEPLEEEMEEEGNTGAAGGEPPEPGEPAESANDENETPANSFNDAIKIAYQKGKQALATQPDDQMAAGYTEG